ncbi:TetR/AcrR family transcriptional regulator [Lactobacillus bombicola]|uniref:TetR/AcrR family transcriptional regulator n=1 Tax=Lactobacillus bombicola TaxID=1505723 RepID=UPI000E57CDB1|nr:TetR/AcrR family transcriptional regulator [Lactobacillus bombicola]RHW49494.1 TetR/AcrR family transcriptional regulator [Lactobacillus bombicola]
MVKSTFINLPQAKKDLIQQALLNEFGTYPLQEAQVARIVKDAGIARGTFYKYFIDLKDAYQYLYLCAMAELHVPIPRTSAYKPRLIYNMVVDFIEQTQCSKYVNLIKLHILYNESMVNHPFPSALLSQLSAQNWSAMVLSHGAIRMIFENPQQEKVILERFRSGLELLEKGAN